MNTRHPHRTIPALALCLAATAATAGQPATATAASLPGHTLQEQGGHMFTTEQLGTAQGIPARTLAEARNLYRALRIARQAAYRHNVLDTRSALTEATQVLNDLRKPCNLAALMHATDVIRDDLSDQAQPPNARLWLPLKAEQTRIRTQVPASLMPHARRAIRNGTPAMRRGDRDAAGNPLDDLEHVLGYRFTLLPFDRVRGDLQSADAAMATAPPRWQGVTEALESALDSVEWTTDLHANGWLSAYQHVADALGVLAGQLRVARRDLRAIASDLAGWTQTDAIRRQALGLAASPGLNKAGVIGLLDRIRALIPGATASS